MTNDSSSSSNPMNFNFGKQATIAAVTRFHTIQYARNEQVKYEKLTQLFKQTHSLASLDQMRFARLGETLAKILFPTYQ